MSDIPGHLAPDAAAAWHELVTERERIGLPGLRPGVLEAAAVQVARMRDAAARIAAEGLIVADEKGRPVPHPALDIERAAQEQLRRLVG